MALKKSTKKFVVSDESLNSHGFKVQTSGISLEQFISNPVGLLNHNYDKVICLWPDLALSGSILTGIPEFDDSDDEALKICNKVEDGFIKGCSIGITAVAWDGDTVTECILKEISITPLPANKNAVVLYDHEGIKLNDDQAKQFLLSLKPADTNPENKIETQMNEKTKKALIALAVQMGITLVLSDSEERFEDIATKASEKILELTGKITTLSEARAVKMVDDALAANKITAEDKELYLSQAKLNPDHTEKFLAKLPAVELNINNLLGKKETGAAADDKDPRKDWTFSDWSKKDSAGLATLKLSDLPKFKALYKEEYKEEFEG